MPRTKTPSSKLARLAKQVICELPPPPRAAAPKKTQSLIGYVVGGDSLTRTEATSTNTRALPGG